MKRKSGEEGGEGGGTAAAAAGRGGETEAGGAGDGLDEGAGVADAAAAAAERASGNVGDDEEETGGGGLVEGIEAEVTATADEAGLAAKETVMEVVMDPFPELVELVEIVTGPGRRDKNRLCHSSRHFLFIRESGKNMEKENSLYGSHSHFKFKFKVSVFKYKS